MSINPSVLCVNQSAHWYSYAANTDPWPIGQAVPTPPVLTIAPANNWDWDSQADPFYGTKAWWRTWVIIHSPNGTPWPAPTATWGHFNWGDGTAWNWAGSQNDRQALQNIAQKWKGAHTYVPAILVDYSSNSQNFPPNATPGGPFGPDGFWGHWSLIKASGGYARVYAAARILGSGDNISIIDGVT